MGKIRQFFKEMNTRRVKTNLIFILAAAFILELISGIQFYYSRQLLEIQLEEDAEKELTDKESIMNSSRTLFENTLTDHIWDMERYLSEPDSIYIAAEWILRSNPHLMCAGIAFTPYFYPQKGRLFEPYAYRHNDEIGFKQLGNDQHDYTQGEIYQYVTENNREYWSEPYFDSLITQRNLITYSIPIRKGDNEVMAILGLDIETEYLGDTLNTNNRYPSSYVILLDEDGDLIAGPRKEQASPLCVNHVIQVIHDEKVQARMSINNKAYIKTFADPDDNYKGHVFYQQKSGSKKWLLAVVCYDDEVFGPLMKMRRNVLILMLLALVVLTIVILRFIRNDVRLEKAHNEQERISTELRVANEIQQSMLPRHHVQLDDAEIYGFLVPAKEVGGDLYDHFVRNGKLFFCIGDVSGKGAPAAMLMGVTHSHFRAFSTHENNPARIMQAINEASCLSNDRNMFVTLFIGVLDLPTGRLRYCDAGHDEPFIIDNTQKKATNLPCNPHLPVGVLDDTQYTMQEAVLPAESILFLYTDGLTEAMNPKHKQYSLSRVQTLMDECAEKALSPKETIDAVSVSVHAFVGDAVQSDDLTMMAIHYTPASFNSTVSETLVIKNEVSEIKRFNTFIKNVTTKLAIDASLAGQLRLAVEEALVNVVQYAFPAGKEGEITVCAESDGQTLRISISDMGVPFDPTLKEKADTNLSAKAEDWQLGGLGILLFRELMDSVNYERTNGQNILTLTKKL